MGAGDLYEILDQSAPGQRKRKQTATKVLTSLERRKQALAFVESTMEQNPAFVVAKSRVEKRLKSQEEKIANFIDENYRAAPAPAEPAAPVRPSVAPLVVGLGQEPGPEEQRSDELAPLAQRGPAPRGSFRR